MHVTTIRARVRVAHGAGISSLTPVGGLEIPIASMDSRHYTDERHATLVLQHGADRGSFDDRSPERLGRGLLGAPRLADRGVEHDAGGFADRAAGFGADGESDPGFYRRAVS